MSNVIPVIKRSRLEGMIRSQLEGRGGHVLESGDGYVVYSRPHPDTVLVEDLGMKDEGHIRRALSRVEDVAASEGRHLCCVYLRSHSAASNREYAQHDILIDSGYQVIQDSFFITLYRKELV
jgi:hypothetical protein